MRLPAIFCAITLLLAGCSSSGRLGRKNESVSAVMARWSTSVEALSAPPAAAARDAISGLRASFPHATEVEIRALPEHGNVLADWTGGQSVFGGIDVAFVGRPGGYPAEAAKDMAREFLTGLLADSGVSSYTGVLVKRVTERPFRAKDHVYGGYLPDAGRKVRVSGFRAGRPPVASGTSFAFVAHGVGVVVIASTFTRDEADRVVRALQGD